MAEEELRQRARAAAAGDDLEALRALVHARLRTQPPAAVTLLAALGDEEARAALGGAAPRLADDALADLGAEPEEVDPLTWRCGVLSDPLHHLWEEARVGLVPPALLERTVRAVYDWLEPAATRHGVRDDRCHDALCALLATHAWSGPEDWVEVPTVTDGFRNLAFGKAPARLAGLLESAEWIAKVVNAFPQDDGLEQRDPAVLEGLTREEIDRRFSWAKDRLRAGLGVYEARRLEPSAIEELSGLLAIARELAAWQPNAPPEVLDRLAGDPSVRIRRRVAAHSATPSAALGRLIEDGDEAVRAWAASNSSLTAAQLEQVARDPEERVRAGAAQNPGLVDLPRSVVDALLDDAYDVQRAVSRNPCVTPEQLIEAVERDGEAQGWSGGLSDALFGQAFSPAQLERLIPTGAWPLVAQHPSTPPALLVKLDAAQPDNHYAMELLAAHPATPPELLDALARRSPKAPREYLLDPLFAVANALLWIMQFPFLLAWDLGRHAVNQALRLVVPLPSHPPRFERTRRFELRRPCTSEEAGRLRVRERLRVRGEDPSTSAS